MNDIKRQLQNLRFKNLQKIETPHKSVDVKFFEAMGVTVKILQYWQVALEYPDLPKQCRFMWYPTTGTLVYEGPHGNTRQKKQYFDSEEVWLQILKRVN